MCFLENRSYYPSKSKILTDLPQEVTLPMSIRFELDVNKHRYIDLPHVYVHRPKCNKFADPPTVYKRKDKEILSNGATAPSVLHTTSGKATQLFALNFSSTPIPTNYYEVVSNPGWYKAMQEEISALHDNGT